MTAGAALVLGLGDVVAPALFPSSGLTCGDEVGALVVVVPVPQHLTFGAAERERCLAHYFLSVG